LRFGVAGFIILVENSMQMTIYYDDQLTVGNTWAWYLSVAPMLSNVLYSKWCGALGPALYYLYQGRPYALKAYYFGLGLGAVLCGGIQLVMRAQLEKHFVPEQPAYTDLMRHHNPVVRWFLVAVYALLAAGVAYTVYTYRANGTEEPTDAAEEGEAAPPKLTFVEVFVNDGSSNYDKQFHQFHIIRGKLIQ